MTRKASSPRTIRDVYFIDVNLHTEPQTHADSYMSVSVSFALKFIGLMKKGNCFLMTGLIKLKIENFTIVIS